MVAERERETSDTMPAEEPPEPVPPTGGPPLTTWDHYELFGLLGQGAMGVVYRARDRQLDRPVAIKFLHGVDPSLTMRLVREARAQARIDHPHVCRVNEVGEVEGRAYIALQLVEGEPLHKIAERMSLDAKVALMTEVAAAIQEAHQCGVIHRDIKPANILVESREAGWFPIVTDFGLAREATAEARLTRSGALIGTPSYMSPEQARGDVRAIDRRSDVYGLGATLYELLTGRPPFADPSLAQLLSRVIQDEPPPPRSLVPSLPIDLETVTLKCLAKDPAQRYPSARSLADDLARYLADQPILGRRPSLWQRLRTRTRRHRSLVVLGAISFALLAVVGSFGIRAWLVSRSERARSAERTILARQLGEQAKEIELFLRTAYQLPLQDIRPERGVIRARMRSIAATHHDLGTLGEAVIHDALGRGHLALHEWDEAADELARAAETGLRTPELHAARGRALGELYHRALGEARRSGDRTWLAGRQKELAQQYLTPAVAELVQSSGAGESAALLGVLIALYRSDFATAETAAMAASEHAPWLFEARKLAADAAYGAAMAAFDHGDYERARPGLERAEALYAQASEIARSDASVYEAAAQALLQRAEVEFRQGRSPRQPLDRALEAIDRALHADPDSAPANTAKAYLLLRGYQLLAPPPSEDSRPLLDRIAQAAERAVEIDPRDAGAWDALGNAHVFRGNYESYHRGQGAPWWNRAIEEFDRALAIRPNDPWANNDLGTAHRWYGANLDQTGRDPMPEYEAGLRSYERATALDPGYVYAWSNLADLHAAIAEHDASVGIDPHPAADDARRAGERCLGVDSSFDAPLHAMAQAYVSLASYLVEHAGDPAEALTIAQGYLDQAERRHPGSIMTWFHRVVADVVDAKFRLRDHTDPTGAVAAGRAAWNKAEQLQPDTADLYVQAAYLDMVEAAWAARTGRNAAVVLQKAIADARQAIKLDDQFAEAQLAAAEVYMQIAVDRRSRDDAVYGLKFANKALEINARLAKALAVRDALAKLKR
jgi:serine/threonine-protein kinase